MIFKTKLNITALHVHLYIVYAVPINNHKPTNNAHNEINGFFPCKD